MGNSLSGNQEILEIVKFYVGWIVCNTLFKERDVHKYTWIRKVRGVIVESAFIDYMCINEKHRAIVTDLNLLRAAGDVQSHHDLGV